MLRKLIFVFSLAACFAFGISQARASLVSIDKEGKVTVKVLASETSLLNVPQPSSLEVKSTPEGESAGQLISLAKVGDKVSLKVGEERTFDVTSWKDNLIEVEEREGTKKITISLGDNGFVINQGGISALTVFPISIDPQKNRFTIQTSTGEKYLAILPYDAILSALRAKVITDFKNKNIEIVESDKDLSYVINGQKTINLFNVYNLVLPVEAKVSASTGEIISTNEPVWMKLLGFFLS